MQLNTICYGFMCNTLDLIEFVIDEFYFFPFNVVDSSLCLREISRFRANSYNLNEVCQGINGFGPHIPRVISEICSVTGDTTSWMGL